MKFSFDRPVSSYSKVQRLVGDIRRNSRAQLRSLPPHPYLNIGCGGNTSPDFVDLDYDWKPGVDLCWDLRRGLPFADGYVQGVFSEHCLEHLSRDDARFVLGEMRRVLAPGGVVRIVLPDAGLYARLYVRAMAGEEIEFPYNDRPQGWTPIDPLNGMLMYHGHRYGYDVAAISSDLARAGFRDIRECQFGVGLDPRLLIDTPHRRCESLYVEATA